MSIKTMLDEEIRNEIELLGKAEVNSEDYKVLVDGIAKLTDRSIELEKVEIERKNRIEDRECENEFKAAQMNTDNTWRMINNVVETAKILLPIGVTIWGTLATFEFEKEGTVTTSIGRGFINKLLPKK